MEASGIIRDAFRARGFDAWSCDLRACERDPRWHLQCNVFDVIARGWRMGIFHPDCTYLTSSGLHWNKRNHGREACTLYGLHTVRRIMDAPVELMCIENPRGRIGTAIRKSDQTLQPHQFGEDAAKETRLWLKRLPKLRPTGQSMGGRDVGGDVDLFGEGTRRWSNQADDGQNRLGETAGRWIERSRTYPGIAEAMASQWGDWLDAISGGVARAGETSFLDGDAILTDGGWTKACNTQNGHPEGWPFRGAGAETGQIKGGCRLTPDPITEPAGSGNP